MVTATANVIAAPRVIAIRPPERVARTAPNCLFLFLYRETYFPSGVTSPCLFNKFVRGIRTFSKKR